MEDMIVYLLLNCDTFVNLLDLKDLAHLRRTSKKLRWGIWKTNIWRGLTFKALSWMVRSPKSASPPLFIRALDYFAKKDDNINAWTLLRYVRATPPNHRGMPGLLRQLMAFLMAEHSAKPRDCWHHPNQHAWYRKLLIWQIFEHHHAKLCLKYYYTNCVS